MARRDSVTRDRSPRRFNGVRGIYLYGRLAFMKVLWRLTFFISFSSSSARWHRSNFISIYFYESRNASLSFILVPYEWDRCWIFASFRSVLKIRTYKIYIIYKNKNCYFSPLNPDKVTERGYRTTRRLLWSRIGSQGPDWEYVEVPIMTVFPNYLQEA